MFSNVYKTMSKVNTLNSVVKGRLGGRLLNISFIQLVGLLLTKLGVK